MSRSLGSFVKEFVILTLMINLSSVVFIRMASSAQYPDLIVTDIYFGDENGAEVLPVAGRKAYLWAIIENIGDGVAYNFYVDMQLEELVVRVGPYSLESYLDFPDKSVIRIYMPSKLSLEARSYKSRVNANPDQLLVGEGALTDSWWGNNELTKTINVTQTGTSITIEKDKTLVNQPITIKGTTEPPTPNIDITLQHRVEDSPWEKLANVKTSNNGSYAYTWTPKNIKTYLIQAVWPKSPDHLEKVKSLVRILVVQTQTTLSCEASPSKIELEDHVVVLGTLSPALEGASIILKYHTPEDSIKERAMVTLSTGAFRDEYTPTVTGIWSVQATWKGNQNYLKSGSQIATFNVVEKAQPTYKPTPTPTMTSPPTPTPTPTSTLTPSPPPTPIRTSSPTPSLTSTPTPTPTPTSIQKENNGLDQIQIMLMTLLVVIIFLWATTKIILKKRSSQFKRS